MTAPCLTFGPPIFALRLSADHNPALNVDSLGARVIPPFTLDDVAIRVTDPSSSQGGPAEC